MLLSIRVSLFLAMCNMESGINEVQETIQEQQERYPHQHPQQRLLLDEHSFTVNNAKSSLLKLSTSSNNLILANRKIANPKSCHLNISNEAEFEINENMEEINCTKNDNELQQHDTIINSNSNNCEHKNIFDTHSLNKTKMSLVDCDTQILTF